MMNLGRICAWRGCIYRGSAVTIRWKEGEEIPPISREYKKWHYGKEVTTVGMRIYKLERRGKREGYMNEEMQWVAWAKPGDQPPKRRIPNWKPISEKYRKNCGFGNPRAASRTLPTQHAKIAMHHTWHMNAQSTQTTRY